MNYGLTYRGMDASLFVIKSTKSCEIKIVLQDFCLRRILQSNADQALAYAGYCHVTPNSEQSISTLGDFSQHHTVRVWINFTLGAIGGVVCCHSCFSFHQYCNGGPMTFSSWSANIWASSDGVGGPVNVLIFRKKSSSFPEG